MSETGKRAFLVTPDPFYTQSPVKRQRTAMVRTKMVGQPKYKARTYRPVYTGRFEMKKKVIPINHTPAAGTLSVTEISNLTRGEAIDERNNNKVRVWRIEFRGKMHQDLDSYIIQGHNKTNPDVADFSGNAGGFLTAVRQNVEFTEWRHIQNKTVNGTNSTGRVSTVIKFPKGIIISYDGTNTAAARNRLHFCTLNGSGAS